MRGTDRTATVIVGLWLACGLAACGGADESSTARPLPEPQAESRTEPVAKRRRPEPPPVDAVETRLAALFLALPDEADPFSDAALLGQYLGDDLTAAVQRLDALLRDPATSAEDRAKALTALELVGPAAAAALEGLVLTVEQDEVSRERAAALIATLGEAGAPAAPRLLAVLQAHTGAPSIAEAIARSGDAGIALLVDPAVLGAGDKTLVDAARAGLRRADPASLVSVVSPLLVDAPPERTRSLLALIGHTGEAGRDAVPAVVRWFDEGDSTTRRSALATLTALGPVAADAVPHLIRELEGQSESFTDEQLINGLIDIGGDDVAAVVAIAGLLSGGPARARVAAVGMRRLGAPSRPALREILAALAGPPSVRQTLLDVLMKIGAGAELDPAMVAELLADHAGGEDRISMLRAISGVGPTMAEHLPRMRHLMLEAESPYERLMASYAIFKVSGAPDALVEGIRRSWTDPESNVRSWGSSFLVDLGPAASVLLDEAADMLVNGSALNDGTWADILALIERLGPRAVDARERVRRFLDVHPGGSHGSSAAEALCTIGVPEPEAVAVWRRQLVSDDTDARVLACRRLADLAPGDLAITHWLRIATRDREWRVREAAREALAKRD